MDITKHGTTGVEYTCGCGEMAGTRTFCGNPTHTTEQCGCYNIGGNRIHCLRHTIYRVGLLSISAAVALAIVISIGDFVLHIP